MEIHTLETERLHIRRLTMDDLDDWMKFVKGKDSLNFFPLMSATVEDGKKWIEFQLVRYEKFGYGLMALIEKVSGEFVGQCGLLNQEVEGLSEIEIGYHILPCFRGKGYASEAAITFKKLAFEKGITDSVISIINPENTASIKVAENNGMKVDFISDTFKLVEGIPHCVYRITKEEFLNEGD